MENGTGKSSKCGNRLLSTVIQWKVPIQNLLRI